MTAFPKYPAYKDSGVAWLGEVPEHWGIERSKWLFSQGKERCQPGDEQLTASQKYGVIPQSKFVELEARRVTTVFLNPELLKRVKKGDFVISMRSFQGGIEASEYDGAISSAYVPLTPREGTHHGFFRHLFKSARYIEALGNTSNLIRDGQALRFENFSMVDLPVVPFDEQQRIASFLDEKTTQIDALIAKKQRQIELLDEQKAILINRAVTRGLHPNPDLQDSGIEWLTSMPRHWQRMKLRHLASMIQTGPFGSQLHSEEYVEGGVPVVNPSHMKDGAIVPDMRCAVSERKATILGRHKLQPGDIVFARRGELGRCALVTEVERDWLCGTGSLLFRPKTGIFDPAYLVQVLSDHRIAALLTLQSVGSTMDNLNTAMIANISIPLPTISEQAAIMKGVAELKAAFQLLGQKVESQIQTLQTLRSTLIAHAVTGKIKV